MPDFQKLCRENPEHAFIVTEKDLQFYDDMSPVFNGKKYNIPAPAFCPDCRQQRRVAQGNQINLYTRKCDLTRTTIISNFHPDSPYKVYRQEDWYSDKWDPLQYGRDFDFTRPFFEQFQELSLVTPRPALQRGFSYDENAEYTNYAGKNKNCYMIFDSDYNRDCYYSYSINRSESCIDCFRVRKSELCSQCVDCVQCYNCVYLQDCSNCLDSMFLKNCIGCKNCLFSSNLRNKEYYVENKKVSKEEFEQKQESLMSYESFQNTKEHFNKLKLQYPQKFMHGIQNENVIGDYLTNCKNCEFCFDSSDLWDCKYVFQAFDKLRDAMDVQECGEAERLYECAFSGYNGYNLLFSALCLGEPSDLLYCTHSPHSKNLFGCVGVMHKQYCILNKQYTEEEYNTLVPQIIEHMRKTGEWGEFFPIELSTFPYNETLAQQYFPLTKQDVLAQGWEWSDLEDAQSKYIGAKVEIADNIQNMDASICSKILICEANGKHYKIIPQEFKFYKQMSIPLPHRCFFCRLNDLMELRNRRKLFDRKCHKCSVNIKTTYSPNQSEIVYCEQCYLDSLD